MSWRNILKEDIVKYENVNNMTTKKFGLRVISALESLGFEIQYDQTTRKYKRLDGFAVIYNKRMGA